MKPRSAKGKGRRLQAAIVQEILARFSHLTADDVRSNPMGSTGSDILLSTAAKQHIPFAIEAKNQERLNIWSAIRQCELQAEKQRLTPLVVISRNRERIPYAVLPLPTLLDLLMKR